jgi:AraC-like DNA-binding protein
VSILKEINRWFTKYKDSLLTYKDGFWVVPYLSNSPEAIVKSIAKMPFTKHSKKRQLIRSTTPLMKGGFYYEKIEKGFWIMPSHMQYKVNISYNKVNDEKMSDDWFILSMTAFGVGKNQSLVDGISYSNCSWVLFKPGAGNINCHFKGADEISITFFLHSKWLKKVLYSNGSFLNSPLRSFFESDATTSIWSDDINLYKPFYEPLYSNFYKFTGETRGSKEKDEVKKLSYQMIEQYIAMYQSLEINSNLFLLSEKNRNFVYKAEKKILQSLMKPFIGIENLAKELGTSETNLKSNFKKVFGKTLFQYFQEKQMLLAKEILLNQTIQISDLALALGYESASKFTAAFKKKIGVLPSQILQKKIG